MMESQHTGYVANAMLVEDQGYCNFLMLICVVTDQINFISISLNYERFAGYCVICSLLTNPDTYLVFWQI